MKYWNDTKRLMFSVLGIWFFFSFIIHAFVVQLNTIVILGFPLGYYMASQGSLIVFVVLTFYFSYAQDNIDQKHDVAGDN